MKRSTPCWKLSLSACLLVMVACQRRPPEPEARERVQAGSTSAVAPAPVSTTGAYRLPGAERLVAVGDVHGDLASTREALRLAGAIDANDHWIGKGMTLVQTGDQLDRGDDEPEVLALLEKLETEATRAGGRVIVLNGNHELMNVAGDLRYVTREGETDFAHAGPSRQAAFAPGSELAKKLAERRTIVAVGDTLFAHAGVLPKHVSYGLDRINEEVSRWLRGDVRSPPSVVTEDSAPVWTRLYGDDKPDADACATLSRVLDSLALERMVIGHTVQKGGINSACNGKVYRIDVGLSDYYGQNPTQVLEIKDGQARVLGAK